MKSLLEMIDVALNDLKTREIIERLDPDFTRFVHGASIHHIHEALSNSGISKTEIDDQIFRTYQQEMKLQETYGLRYLTTTEGFDRLSYAIFKVFFMNVNPSQRKEKIIDVTSKIGRDICDWFNLKLKVYPDYENLPNIMGQICRKFIETGYCVDARILTEVKDGTGRLYQYDPTLLARGEVTHFGYEMKYPVILPSAIELFREYGEAQHFSSRTIQAYLGKFGLKGGEIDFNPGEHSPENVLELWGIQKL